MKVEKFNKRGKPIWESALQTFIKMDEFKQAIEDREKWLSDIREAVFNNNKRIKQCQEKKKE